MSLFEDDQSDVMVCKSLWMVTVINQGHLLEHTCLAYTPKNAINAIIELNDNIDRIINVERYYGQYEHIEPSLKQSYRIMGIDKKDRVVINKVDGSEQLNLYVSMDADWIKSSWIRLEQSINA